MNGDEYRDAIEYLGLRKIDAAEFLNVNETTSRRWMAGINEIPLPIVMLLRLMVKHHIEPDIVTKMLERKGDI